MFTSVGLGFFAAALLGLSAVTCGTLLIAGWRSRRHLLALYDGAQDGGAPLADKPPLYSLGRAPFAGGVLDVAAEMRDVLAQMTAEAARQLVHLEFAVQPDLSVHADQAALRAVLSALVANAMRHAPGGRVLLSAMRLGGRVQIAVMDDGRGPAAAAQEAALREVAQLVALQGGTIDVEVYPGEGTTVQVRLPEPTETNAAPGAAAAEAATPQPAQTTAAQEAVAEEHSWET